METGQIPARFEIQKMRLMYLKNILEQNEDSQISKFFRLQMAEPSKGDWVSRCFTDLKELRITEQFDEIRKMKKEKFSTLVKSRVRENALLYLKKKQKRQKLMKVSLALLLTGQNLVLLAYDFGLK